MDLRGSLFEEIQEFPLADTHEHLLDESVRLAGGHPFLGAGDWTVLFGHYVCDDLASCGMTHAARERLCGLDASSSAQTEILLGHWEHVRHTGYGLALRHTLKDLYGIDDLTERTISLVPERYDDRLKTGFYNQLLRGQANILTCQVNSFEDPIFRRTEMPDLLLQDISIADLVSPFNNPSADEHFADHRASLGDWLSLIDATFESAGPKAIAIKSNNAYYRRLDFGPGDAGRAERAFRAFKGSGAVDASDARETENFLFRYMLGKAAEHDLPVKLHTGYQAGVGAMDLRSVRDNASDLCDLAKDFPGVRFVAFHAGYPYQHEMIALAKQFPNIYVDMCWTWSLDPYAAGQFLKSFLVSAPANKVTVFGGDVAAVELVVGHAKLARLGLSKALAGLVEDDLMSIADARALAPQLMYENASRLYGPRIFGDSTKVGKA